MNKKPVAVALAILASIALVAGSVDANRGGRPKPKPRRTTTTTVAPTTITATTIVSGVAQIDIARSGQRLGNHPKHSRSFKLYVNETLVATTIGISLDTLRTELRTGLSVTQVATNRGVETSTISAALTTDMTAQINTALTNGKITQTRATQLLGDLPIMISNYLNRIHYVRPYPTTTTAPSTTVAPTTTTTQPATTTTTAVATTTTAG